MYGNNQILTISDTEIVHALEKISSLQEPSFLPKNYYTKNLVKIGHTLLINDPDGKHALDPFIACYQKSKQSFFEIEKQYDEKISVRRQKKAYYKNALSFVHYNTHFVPAVITVSAAVGFRTFLPDPENYPVAAFATTIGSYAAGYLACLKYLPVFSQKARQEFSQASHELVTFEQEIENKTPEFPIVIDAYNALADNNPYLIKNETDSIAMAYDMVLELAKRRSMLKI